MRHAAALPCCCRLVKYVPLEAMQGRPVIVLCNLKPRNMRGIKSCGMLLAASNAEHTQVEPLVPAQGAAPGSRVWFGQQSEQVRVRGLAGFGW
jgi:aminoacyl tRNA synthase complex-interacting multifunctional protein 1